MLCPLLMHFLKTGQVSDPLELFPPPDASFFSPDVGLVLFGLNGLARKCMGERTCRGHPVSINKQPFEELLCIGHGIDTCMCAFIRQDPVHKCTYIL